MDFRIELLNLLKYCSDSANFITVDDSVEDRYAKQAYLDVIGKIGQIFEREQSANTKPEGLPLHVVTSRTDIDQYEYDEEYMEGQPYESCPKCGRSYDDIDFDFQSCSKCGWDNESESYGETREPEDENYIMGEADLMTGRWL